jgi:hypothetical protein
MTRSADPKDRGAWTTALPSQEGIFVTARRRHPLCPDDGTFLVMACWHHYADTRFCGFFEADGSIIISTTINGRTSFWPPSTRKNPDLVDGRHRSLHQGALPTEDNQEARCR